MKKIIALFVTAILFSVPQIFSQETETFTNPETFGENSIGDPIAKSEKPEAAIPSEEAKSVFDRKFSMAAGGGLSTMEGMFGKFVLRPGNFDIDFGLGLNPIKSNLLSLIFSTGSTPTETTVILIPRLDLDYNITGFRRGFNYKLGLSYASINPINHNELSHLFFFGLNSKYSWIKKNGLEFGFSNMFPIYGLSVSGEKVKGFGIWESGTPFALALLYAGLISTSFDIKYNF